MKIVIVNNPKKRTAETLIEVIMSIFVVALGSAAATSLVISALQTNGLTRDNLLAMNLATEVVEGVRNVRDSNWIKFAFDKQHCWNMAPAATVCVDSKKMSPGKYAISLNIENMKWDNTMPGMPGANPGLDLNDPALAANNELYRLDFKDLDLDVDTNGDGILVNDPDMFVIKGTGTAAAGTSKFYRMVKIEYPTGDPLTDQEFTVTALVQWKERALVHEVRIISNLSNYQKVKVK